MRRIKVLLAVVSAAATMMVLAAPAMAVDFSSDGGLDIEGASCATVCIFSNDFGSGGSLDHDISVGGNTLSFGNDNDLGSGFVVGSPDSGGVILAGGTGGSIGIG